MANPFQAAYQGGQNFARSLENVEQKQKQRQESYDIGQILNRYNDPSNPLSYNQTVNLLMSRVSPENRKSVIDTLAQQEQQKQQQDVMNKRKQFYQSQNLDENLAYLPESIQSQSVKAIQPDLKKQEEKDIELRDYKTIEETFGSQFANLWQAAPQGGKTELLKTAIDSVVRGEDIDQLIKNLPKEQQKQVSDLEKIQNIPKLENKKFPQNVEWPRFDEKPPGYTLKEWKQEKDVWRKENSPRYDENKQKLENTKKDMLSTKNLKKLNESEKLPEGFARTLINPSTGEFYKLAELSQVASPEAQQWIKEIARFQNRAKDSFGARVTNFDLVSFMKQFPNLMNTPEGRRRILNMMDINYQMDGIYQNTLDQVYKKSGLSNISKETADSIVQHMIGDEINNLYEDYLDVSSGKYKINLLENDTAPVGSIATDKKTGRKMQFNGQEWVDIQ